MTNIVIKTIAGLLFTLAGVVSLAGTAVADPVTGGNDVIPRTIQDSFQNFCILDSNNPINGTGQIDEFDIYAITNDPTELVIYRQAGTGHTIVGTSALDTPALGLNQFILPTPISVEAGDLVGLYFAGAASVEFDPVGNSSFSVLYTSNGSGLSDNFIGSDMRTYSVRVLGTTVPEQGTLALLASIAVTATGFLVRRRAH